MGVAEGGCYLISTLQFKIQGSTMFYCSYKTLCVCVY